MRRALLAAAVLALAAGGAYLVLRGGGESGRDAGSRPVALIGDGADAVAVAADGRILRRGPEGLPRLPLEEPPGRPRVRGPLLQQVRVLAAAPRALRRQVESSAYGPTGVAVQLRAGIELRFGDASNAPRKWRAAAAVLADPTLTALDYVNVRAPNRPTVGGSGTELPPAF